MRLCPNCRLLEGLQAQLGSLVEQLSMPLALLPGSNLLLEAAPDLLSHQLSCVSGDSALTANGLLCQALSLSIHAVPGETDNLHQKLDYNALGMSHCPLQAALQSLSWR